MAPTDEMMPTLPEPWEARLRMATTSIRQNGWFDGALTVEAGGPSWLAEQERWNHAAYEAERALRVALRDLLRGGKTGS